MEKSVGPYQLGDVLGALPFGELVAATHPARSESLAILLFDERLAQDHRFRGLIRLEVARAGSVRHRAVARAVEVGEHAGALYVVFERPAETRTLARAFADGDPPSRQGTASLVRAIAEALDVAHGRRLVHAVLGPTTVLIGPNGTVSVVGIGLNGAVEEAGLSSVIAEQTEAAFTAPEQRIGGRAVAASDGYALATLAAALLRVQPPPAGPADAIGNVLARQCSADPDARYPTCAAFASALTDALTPAPRTATDAAPVPAPLSPPLPPPPDMQPAPPLPSPPWTLLDANARSQQPMPGPEPTLDAPLPWNAPASERNPMPAPGDTLNLQIPPDLVDPPPQPARPTAQVSPAEPASTVQPKAAPRDWLSSIIDPPRANQPTAPPRPAPARPREAQPYVGWQPPPSSDTAHTVSTSELTPAMAGLLKPPFPRDPIGDGIRWVSDRYPEVDKVLDRACPDGTVGPFPLGVVAAAALAALLIGLGQGWPATVVIMVVVVLYGVPRAASALQPSDRAIRQARRVTGTMQLKRTPDAIGAGIPQLTLPDGITLSLRVPEYEALLSFARPLTVTRPVYGSPEQGSVDVVVGHELPGATVSYISPDRLLLDIRNPDGTVIFRRSPYPGEPGDRLWSSSDAPPPGLLTTGGTVASPPVTDSASYAAIFGPPGVGSQGSAGAPPSPASGPQHSPVQGAVLPLPPAAEAALKRGAERQKMLAFALAGLGLVGVGFLWGMMGAFSLFHLLFGIPIAVAFGWAHLAKAFKIAGASTPMSMVRVIGPVTVSKYRANKRYRCFVQFADGTRFRIDQGLYGTLESAGEARVEESWVFNFDESRRAPDGYLQGEHVIPAATSTFEPTTQLVLEIRNPFGGTVYRDRGLEEGDLGPNQPTI